MPKIKHIHRFKRIDLGRNGNEFLVYRCIKPGCTTYYRIEMVLGKETECNRCGNIMFMDKLAMTLAEPHCKTCTKVRKTEEIKDVDLVAEFLKTHGS